ncbi:MAG: integrase arm-type DNA-binding domain-containing protein [Pseudomonadales bacterium]
MPKVAKVLTPMALRKLNREGIYSVGGVAGLQLRIAPSGAKYFILRIRFGGKRRDIGIGPFPEISVTVARSRAAEIKDKIRQGVDPLIERKLFKADLANAAPTFDQCAERYITSKEVEFKNPKHVKQWRSTLSTYASPVIGPLPVDRVELSHILKILKPIWTLKTETGSRLRGRIEKVLSYASASGHRQGDNPARWTGNLDAILPQPSKVRKVQHHRALPIDAMPQFMAALRQKEGIAARALEFLVLTAARSGEVRGASWNEIDLTAKTWTIPGERMKAQMQHTVPLSPAAIAILKDLPRTHELIFPAPRGKALSDVSLSAVCRRMAIDATPHGFRSTFRDWCSERTDYPRDVAEMSLAHAIGDRVEAAYRRGDLLGKRKKMMKEWSDFVGTGK